MKIIVSHDVDHLTMYEHFLKDIIVPKFFIRSYIEFILNKISFEELYLRHLEIFTNKWNNIEELVAFNKINEVKGTFFFGMNNGLGLSYNYIDAKKHIDYLIENNVEVGVHGISYNDRNIMKLEFDRFTKISNLDNFGIRMHYLRNDKNSLQIIDKLGYSYDSSQKGLYNPFKNGKVWEFPVCLMDANIFDNNKKWQSRSFQEACDYSKKIIDIAFENQLEYFSLLFHDRYFSNNFSSWKKWYIWIIEYFNSQNLEFINYKEAINELEFKR